MEERLGGKFWGQCLCELAPCWLPGPAPWGCWGTAESRSSVLGRTVLSPPCPSTGHSGNKRNVIAGWNQTFAGFCSRWRVWGEIPPKSHLLSLGPSRVRLNFWTEHHRGSTVELRVSEVNQSLLVTPGRWQSAVAGGAWQRGFRCRSLGK